MEQIDDLDEETTVPGDNTGDKGEIVHVEGYTQSVEIMKQPIKINITVELPADEDWFWVEFDCWGQGCGTLFLTVEDSLRWCTVCFYRNLNRPIRIKDKHGETLYEEEALLDYYRESAW